MRFERAKCHKMKNGKERYDQDATDMKTLQKILAPSSVRGSTRFSLLDPLISNMWNRQNDV